VIYLDNAATSFPKPGVVPEAMARFLIDDAGSPGRSGHALSIRAGWVVHEARERVATRFGLDDPLAVAFTKNATEALNLGIQGVLRPGDHVITSTMEHNSVHRPLRFLEGQGVAVTRLTCGADGLLDPDDVAQAITPRTRLVVLAHASNVTGGICPISEVGRITAEREVLLLVDAAQTAGVLPLDMTAMHLDLVAFTGHKSLLGPTGTGGLCLGPRARDRVRPLLHGGTGSASDSDVQPGFLPDALEAGTLNTVGLSGLAAALAFIETRGLDAIRAHEQALVTRLLDGLAEIPGVTVPGPRDPTQRTAVVSFNLEGWSCAEVAQALEDRAGICCRAGLHCAPLAHRQLGTFPHGMVRLSPGAFTTDDEIDTALGVIAELASASKGTHP
jgi:cysteine desulfurase family protein